MKKIGWIHISTRRYGGGIYGEHVREVLQSRFDVEQKLVEAKHVPWRYLKPLEWIIRFVRLRDKKDLWIYQSFIAVAAFSLSRMKGKKLVLIHHLDNSVFPRAWRPVLALIEKLFYRNLYKVDMIVTVSEYWRDYFTQRKYPNVRKVSIGFDVRDFGISSQEVERFRERFGLTGKPIVYIGNCVRAKGVQESFEALKGLDVFLVTSGEKRLDIPALNFNLSYRDYLCLLKACSVVVAMSIFQEGWCLTAHEAMLLKTPVIGSGRGGMRELLEGGGQIICEDFGALRQKVVHLLDHPEERERLGEKGFLFAKEFTKEKFAQAWLGLVSELLGTYE